MNSSNLYEFIKIQYHKELNNLINLVNLQDSTLDLTICHTNKHLPLFHEYSLTTNYIHILSNNSVFDSNGNLLFLIGIGYTDTTLFIKSGINTYNFNNYEILPYNGINLFSQIKIPFNNLYNQFLSIHNLNNNLPIINDTLVVSPLPSTSPLPLPSPLPSPSPSTSPLPETQQDTNLSIPELDENGLYPNVTNTGDIPDNLPPLEPIGFLLSIADLNPNPNIMNSFVSENIPHLENYDHISDTDSMPYLISDTDSIPELIDNPNPNIIIPNTHSLDNPFTFSTPIFNKYFKLKNTYPLEKANDLESAIKKLNQLINQKNILLDRAPTMDNSILGIDVNLYIVSLCQDDKGWSIRIGKNLIDSTYSTKSYITNTDYSYISYLLIPS